MKTKMTINELSNAIIKNMKKATEIGWEKKYAGTPKEILQMRMKGFKDLHDWKSRGCSDRKKAEMELLYKRSLRMVETFNRL